MFLWSLLWWLVGGLGEINRRVEFTLQQHAAFAYLGTTSVLCSLVERTLQIRVARWPALSVLAVIALFTLLDWSKVPHPFAQFGWVAWPIAWSAFYFTLRRHEDEVSQRGCKLLHVGGIWLLAIFLSREVAWLIERVVAGGRSWPAIAWAMAPAIALLLMPRLRRKWPFVKHEYAYAFLASAGFAIYLFAWSVITSFTRDGDPWPLPYVPLLNPLDVAQAFVLLAAVTWLRSETVGHAPVAKRARWPALGLVVFIWLNAVLLRTIHYWVHVPYEPYILWQATIVQAALSIFWTTLALATTLIATQRRNRMLWCVGFALLAIVVVKLFFIDLSRVGSIARIVSFIGVGFLMLVIGYFAPIPPQQKEQTS